MTIKEIADGTACRAFLAIWHDIAPDDEAEFELWHTREHMPERLALRGFARGRRGHAPRAARQRWVTLYESAELATFDSAAYRARLDDPTPWTRRLQPSFLDFARVACETIATAGSGVGGATATLRLSVADGAEAPLEGKADGAAAHLQELDGVTSVKMGVVRPEVASAATGRARSAAASIPATPVGMREGDPPPIDVERIAPPTVVADVIVEPTRFTRLAEARKCSVHVGSGMMNHQLAPMAEHLGYGHFDWSAETVTRVASGLER